MNRFFRWIKKIIQKDSSPVEESGWKDDKEPLEAPISLLEPRHDLKKKPDIEEQLKKDFKEVPTKKHISKLIPTKKKPPEIPVKKSLIPHNATQVNDKAKKDERDIIIGFDFGSSNTKIVLRDSALKKAYAIPFKEDLDGKATYLFPSKVYLSENSEFSLQSGGASIVGIKQNLINNPDRTFNFKFSGKTFSVTANEFVTAYIALVVQKSRSTFLERHGELYANTHIYWWLNIGMPSEPYDNEELNNRLFLAVNYGWNSSLTKGPITLLSIQKVINETERYLEEIKKPDSGKFNTEFIHPSYVGVCPEVIAEVVGHFHSPLRTEGLHLLIDIGARTFDVATFILHKKDGEDIYPLLECKVEPLGAIELHKNRLVELEKYIQKNKLSSVAEKHLETLKKMDVTLKIPPRKHYEMPRMKVKCIQFDTSFGDDCRKSIGGVVGETRNARDPMSKAWESMLPVFVCGGGKDIELYNEKIEDLSAAMQKSFSKFRGFDIKPLPIPESLRSQKIPLATYSRLAVAYGLSHTPDEIGQVIPPREIDDIKLDDDSTFDPDDNFISKDMC